jgi:hypothetical protein
MRRIFLTSILMLGAGVAAFPQAQPQRPPQEETPPALTVPKDYRYNAQGRRDPFVNPVPKPKPPVQTGGAPQVPRPPGLKGVLVAEAQVAGVVTSKEPSMNVVIIAAPGAKTPYFARVGDQLFDAVIKNITMQTVTFTATGPTGDARTPREIVRQVRPKPGEK